MRFDKSWRFLLGVPWRVYSYTVLLIYLLVLDQVVFHLCYSMQYYYSSFWYLCFSSTVWTHHGIEQCIVPREWAEEGTHKERTKEEDLSSSSSSRKQHLQRPGGDGRVTCSLLWSQVIPCKSLNGPQKQMLINFMSAATNVVSTKLDIPLLGIPNNWTWMWKCKGI